MRNGLRKKSRRCLKTYEDTTKVASDIDEVIIIIKSKFITMEINVRDEFIDLAGLIACGKLEERKGDPRNTGRKWDNYLIINNLLRN